MRRRTAVAGCATAALLLSACSSGTGTWFGQACAPASLIATQPHAIDSVSPLIDGSLASQLGLARSVVAGTVTDASTDDSDGRGLKDGRITLETAEVLWDNPASTAEPPQAVTADYLAVSDDSGQGEICVGDRVWVLLTQPEDDTASPPVYLAQAAIPFADGTEGTSFLPESVRGADEDQLGPALRDLAGTIPAELNDVVDLPMEERLAELERASG